MPVTSIGIVNLPLVFDGPAADPAAPCPTVQYAAQYRVTDPNTGAVTVEEGPVLFTNAIPDGVPDADVVLWEDVLSYWIEQV